VSRYEALGTQSSYCEDTPSLVPPRPGDQEDSYLKLWSVFDDLAATAAAQDDL